MNSSDVAASAANALNAPAATALVGSLPGDDSWEATAVVRGELPELPGIVELPARGPGADMVGRTMALLAAVSTEFAVTTTPTGWRLAGHRTSTLPSVMRRASSWLAEDLDAAESAFADFSGSYKIQLAGPWTAAASIELANGDRLLRDNGAVAELQSAFREALIAHVAQVNRRLPNARLFVQLDEPMIDQVLQGSVVTPSGFDSYPAVAAPHVSAVLATLTDTAREMGCFAGVHTCATDPPLALLRTVNCDFTSFDVARLTTSRGVVRDRADEELGLLLDLGRMLFAGLPVDIGNQPEPRRTLAPLSSALARLGIGSDTVLNQLVLTPTCGLAGSGSLANVQTVISHLNVAGRALRDERVEEAGSSR